MSVSARRLRRAQQSTSQPGISDILPGKPITSSAGENSGFGLANLTDGNLTTRWVSRVESPAELLIDLLSVHSLTKLVGVWVANCTRDFSYDVSLDGTNWTTVATGSTNGTDSAQTITHQIAAQARYIRLNLLSMHNASYGNSLYELQVFGSPDPNYPVGTISDLTATVDSAAPQVSLSWSYSGSPLAHYTITRDGAVLATLTDQSATSYVDDTVALGARYTYAVTGTFSQNGASTNTASVSASVVDPNAVPTWPLRVSDNKRFLVGDNGVPFIWQGDTAWTLSGRSTREEVVTYLDTRQAQGFNVVQMTAIPRIETIYPTNSYGDNPYNGDVSSPITTPGNDPNDPAQYDYWDHIDFIIEQALQRGIYIALLPVWSRTMSPEGSLNAGIAEGYGYWLGQRYATTPIIWMLGGDDEVKRDDTWNNMARGIARGVGGGTADYSKALITYHTGSSQTAPYFYADWLDFNTEQSGHCNNRSYDKVAYSYGLTPTKPTMDAEPYYEGHPLCWDPNRGYSTPQQVRSAQYTAVFAGGFGFTYGHQSVWQMYAPDRPGTNAPITYWYDSLDAEAATQMQYLRKLLESRPILTRIPDQSIITSSHGDLWTRVQATRASDGAYLMVYTSIGRTIGVDLGILSGTTAHTYWYNPRTGDSIDNGTRPSGSAVDVATPTNDDWVFVADDDSRGFAAPGTSS